MLIGMETVSIPPYGASLAVCEALDVYLKENGFTKEEYDAPKVRIKAMGVSFWLPNPATRKVAVRRHDLHHVLTGYGTDLCGEAEVSAWELRRGIGAVGLYVKMLITSITLFGFVHSPRRTWRAWAKGPGDSTLFGASDEEYHEALRMSVGDLRERFELPRAGIATERALHSAAPKTSG